MTNNLFTQQGGISHILLFNMNTGLILRNRGVIANFWYPSHDQTSNPVLLCDCKFLKKIGPPTQLIDVFITIDDFVTLFDQWLSSRILALTCQPTRPPELSSIQIMTILVYYHHSGYKNFQLYYRSNRQPCFVSGIGQSNTLRSIESKNSAGCYKRPAE
ncbi:hypothetical protein SAMN05216167_10442 [Spirosoma endophyticum]|uniref:Uncharacterized protein n=1 Tax=Spirosoma endophyticum TaxID=662367 RepID=A0A1I1R0I2_9BACT|nr:hypothetical protein SAMN05216167_10442 [Spirosoma endophyticum]